MLTSKSVIALGSMGHGRRFLSAPALRLNSFRCSQPANHPRPGLLTLMVALKTMRRTAQAHGVESTIIQSLLVGTSMPFFNLDKATSDMVLTM